MREIDDLKDLKKEYLELVRIHGEEATGFKEVRRSLLDLNRQSRMEAARIYATAIAMVEKRIVKGRRPRL